MQEKFSEILKICPICSKKFTRRHSKQKYCSEKCKKIGYNLKTKQYNDTIKQTKIKQCQQCNREFEVNKSNLKYCSKECRETFNRTNLKRKQKIRESERQKRIKNRVYKIHTCRICGKKFETHKKRIKCCSKECTKKFTIQYDRISYLEYKKYLEQHIETKNKRKKYAKNWFYNKLKSDSFFKFKWDVRYLIYSSFKKRGFKKIKHTEQILGCTISEFKSYIEKQFKPGMTWENHTIHGWHIDHIIPIATAKTEEEVIKLNHHTNLRPLWAEENWKRPKKDKVYEEDFNKYVKQGKDVRSI